MKTARILTLCGLIWMQPALISDVAAEAETISIEAESPLRQRGSIGEDRKAGASGGKVLGREFGSRPGHFAEYAIEASEEIAPARISLRYARAFSGYGDLEIQIDGKRIGLMRYEFTGGWGEVRKEFRWLSLDVAKLTAGEHRLLIKVLKPRVDSEFRQIPIKPSEVLDRVGGRDDKNSVGHGNNLALYTGTPSRYFFATHELGNIFSATDGGTLTWYPDQVIVSPEAGGSDRPNLNIDKIVISKSPLVQGAKPIERPVRKALVEQRQVAVTKDDVIVSRIWVFNSTDETMKHRIEVTGDCRASRNWRGKQGGEKASRKAGDFMTLVDKNVFPKIIAGLHMVIGGSRPPTELNTRAAGTYFMNYDVEVEPHSSVELVLACAVHPDLDEAQRRLVRVLSDKDPLATNREEWQTFYRDAIPEFRCSDAGFEELYAFRWFLLRFSTVGGKLGYFEYPVVLEGRQAYQTYCCFSAPFMAFDMNWSTDPRVGFGHMASMAIAAHPDGRFPWYTSPNTNQVPIHHRSGTGMSLLPLAAWKHFQVHGSKKLLAELYLGMRKNVEWWIADRDGDGDGLFVIDHQLETGMDDLTRWPDPRLRYHAVDASSYAYANLRAVASMAGALGLEGDAKRYSKLAEKTGRAVREHLWQENSASFRDRHPETSALSEMLCITTFYPAFAGLATRRESAVFRRHLLNPAEFWTAHPVPALSKTDPTFKSKGFWRGPAWPAATSHVVEAFASYAKKSERELLPDAAELLRRSVGNHLQTRADFFERYEPNTGEALSSFRDYMHSWWIDIFVRHVVGLEPGDSGDWSIDPLPLGFEHFAMRGIPFRGHRIDVAFEKEKRVASEFGKGLTVRVDGKVLLRRPEFTPGSERLSLAPISD